MKISSNQKYFKNNNQKIIVKLHLKHQLSALSFTFLYLLSLLSSASFHYYCHTLVVGASSAQDWQPLETSWHRHVILDHPTPTRTRHHLTPRNLIYQAARSESENVETFYIRKGANGSLPCLPVQSGDSQSTLNKIEWFKEDKKLVEAEKRHIVVWNSKNSIAYLPETGALFFRGVTSEDSGEYQCILTKTTSSGEIEYGVVRFYVQGKYCFSFKLEVPFVAE